MFGAVDAEDQVLLEDPSSDVPRKLRVSRGYIIGERLPSIRVAKELDAARKNDTRVLGCLEACDEAELATCPETLSSLFRSVDNSACTRVVGGVSCEARCGCAEDGDEVGTIAECVWGTGEPDGGSARRDDG